jgi:hypothetical protein
MHATHSAYTTLGRFSVNPSPRLGLGLGLGLGLLKPPQPHHRGDMPAVKPQHRKATAPNPAWGTGAPIKIWC